MGFDRRLSTAEVSAAVERAFARQEGQGPKSIRTDNPVIGELASLDTLEYELQRGTAAAELPQKSRYRTNVDLECESDFRTNAPTAVPSLIPSRLDSYLKRALAQLAPLSRPADLAWLLASYARDALALRGDIESALSQKARELQTQLARLGGETRSGPKRRGSTLKGRKVPIKFRPLENCWTCVHR
jgi:hypothetical protein